MATNTKPAACTRAGKAFSFGDRVEVLGLQKSPHLNHRLGIIVGGLMDNGRYPVTLDKACGDLDIAPKKIALKPDNLQNFSFIPKNCSWCMESFSQDGLMVCQKCEMVEYCSKECQLSHWHKCHKDQCKTLEQGRKARHDESKLPTDNPWKRRAVRSSRAIRWIDKGKYANAEAEYRTLIKENPPGSIASADCSHYVLLVQAILLQESLDDNQLNDIVAFLRVGVTLPALDDPENSLRMQAYQYLVENLYKKGDLDGSEQACEEMIALGSTNNPMTLTAKTNLEEIRKQRRMFAFVNSVGQKKPATK